jgi:preprotein translocase subunit SecD
MAVDGNVLIFERLKEELRANPARPLTAHVRNAYDRAFTAILDGNVTTLLMAFVLYFLGTGPLRGFAVTLSIGIALSMFTAIVVTRRFQNLLAVTKLGQNRNIYRH